MELFVWIDGSGLAAWVREGSALWPYDIVLAAHAVGMGVVVGLSAGVALRILGFAPSLPLAPMERFFPLMYGGFWVNAASGVLLFIAYPIKAVTNPGFFIKMGAVVLAVLCLRRLRHRVFGDPACLGTGPVPASGKILAGLLLFTWGVAITAGRLLAYHETAGVERQTLIAVLIATSVMLAAGFTTLRLWGRHRQLRPGA